MGVVGAGVGWGRPRFHYLRAERGASAVFFYPKTPKATFFSIFYTAAIHFCWIDHGSKCSFSSRRPFPIAFYLYPLPNFRVFRDRVAASDQLNSDPTHPPKKSRQWAALLRPSQLDFRRALIG